MLASRSRMHTYVREGWVGTREANNLKERNTYSDTSFYANIKESMDRRGMADVAILPKIKQKSYILHIFHADRIFHAGGKLEVEVP